MGPIRCPETSLIDYHYPLRNRPEERSSYLLRGGNLKSPRFFNDVQEIISCILKIKEYTSLCYERNRVSDDFIVSNLPSGEDCIIRGCEVVHFRT